LISHPRSKSKGEGKHKQDMKQFEGEITGRLSLRNGKKDGITGRNQEMGDVGVSKTVPY